QCRSVVERRMRSAMGSGGGGCDTYRAVLTVDRCHTQLPTAGVVLWLILTLLPLLHQLSDQRLTQGTGYRGQGRAVSRYGRNACLGVRCTFVDIPKRTRTDFALFTDLIPF